MSNPLRKTETKEQPKTKVKVVRKKVRKVNPVKLGIAIFGVILLSGLSFMAVKSLFNYALTVLEVLVVGLMYTGGHFVGLGTGALGEGLQKVVDFLLSVSNTFKL